jgi:hypothetical protein
VFQHPPGPGARVDAVVGHLLPVPAGPDAELEPAARDPVEGRDRLGKADRVVLEHQRDGRAERDPLRLHRHRGQRDVRVVRMPVAPGQLRPAGPRRLPGRGDVGVLGEEQPVEPALLGGARQRRPVDAVVGQEDEDAVLHMASVALH